MKIIGTAFLCMVLAFGCGGGDGGSGVDEGTLLVEITPDESDAVCEAALGQPVDEREVDCGDGTTVTVTQPDAEDIADCADTLDSLGDDFPDCDATVGDFNDCFDDLANATDDELCAAEPPASCDFLFTDPDCGGGA